MFLLFKPSTLSHVVMEAHANSYSNYLTSKPCPQNQTHLRTDQEYRGKNELKKRESGSSESVTKPRSCLFLLKNRKDGNILK